MSTKNTDEDFEIQVTKQIAATCNFEIRDKDYKCNQCGKRFSKNYVATRNGHNNERMLMHFNVHQHLYQLL